MSTTCEVGYVVTDRTNTVIVFISLQVNMFLNLSAIHPDFWNIFCSLSICSDYAAANFFYSDFQV